MNTLQAMIEHYSEQLADQQAVIVALENAVMRANADLYRLREAIAAWPNTYFHSAKCLKFEECTCGVREAKLARMYARRVAGLEEP